MSASANAKNKQAEQHVDPEQKIETALDKTELYSSVSSGSVSAVPSSEIGGIAGYANPRAVVRDSAYSGELPPVGL